MSLFILADLFVICIQNVFFFFQMDDGFMDERAIIDELDVSLLDENHGLQYTSNIQVGNDFQCF